MSFIGKKPPRVDGFEKVTGLAKFADDISFPNMFYGKVKRSPYAHAKILNIDISKAERLSGVRAIATAKDLPGGFNSLMGIGLDDEPLLCRDRVRYIGDPVAAVAADTVEIAEEAVERINVEYEELPAILDPEEALKPDCPVIIHPQADKYYSEIGLTYKIRNPKQLSNVSNSFFLEKGDVEKGFKEADLIVENRYTTQLNAHCSLDPHSSIADCDFQGNITIWTNTQTPYRVRNQLSKALGKTESQIRIIVTNIGGSFGGKSQYTSNIGISAVLAQKARKPVKITLTREEIFEATTIRHPYIIYIKDGVKKDGKIVARKMKMITGGGAYTEGGITYIRGNSPIINVYKIDNIKIDTFRVYTNHMTAGAMRGPTDPQPTWAIENQMDIIAEKLGIDPVELRLKNILDEGDTNVLGHTMHSVGAKECLKKVAEAIGWEVPIEKGDGIVKRGRGIALGCKGTPVVDTNALVKVFPDGIIEVRSSGTEMGQGSLTILSQIAAEEFNVPISKIRMVQVDTAVTPWDSGTTASRQTLNSGGAIILACQDAKRQLFEKSARVLGNKPENLETRDGKIYIKGSEKCMDFRELWNHERARTLRGGVYWPDDTELIGKGIWRKQGNLDSYSAQAFDVEVDITTGIVKVLRFVGSIDCGKALNPSGVEGQLIGGALAMGMPYALYEQLILRENGKLANPNFTDYKLPTFQEMPYLDKVKAIIVESAPTKYGVWGAKGIGEAVMIPTAPAIGNAIYDAIGVRIKVLPITPDKILQALDEKRTNKLAREKEGS